MADPGAPIHDAAAIRIPFTPNRDETDQWLGDLQQRMDGLADRFVARIRAGIAEVAPEQTDRSERMPPQAAPEKPVMVIENDAKPPTVPQAVWDDFRRVTGAESSAANVLEGQEIKEILKGIQASLDRMAERGES